MEEFTANLTDKFDSIWQGIWQLRRKGDPAVGVLSAGESAEYSSTVYALVSKTVINLCNLAKKDIIYM